MMMKILFSLSVLSVCATGQRIMTIQLDGIQYYISRMNPYSPELNYYLAYQYCRSLGLQLASFDSKEKYTSIVEYLTNANYKNYDFWTSGNRLGTGMFLWMSTGLPFNSTFDYFVHDTAANGVLDPVDHNGNTSPQRTARDNAQKPLDKHCVLLKAPNLMWEADDCLQVKDFICEQTRCYYYNYGSIPVTTNQGRKYTGGIVAATTSAPQTFKDTTAFYVSLMGSTKSPLATSDEEEVEEEQHSDETTTENEEETHHDEEAQEEEEEHIATTSSEDAQTEASDEGGHHDEEEEVPVEQRLRQLTDDLGRLDSKLGNSNDDENRQSFLSLSDLIKTLRPNDDKPLQIDSSYSRSQVLGEKPDIIYHPRNAAATGDIANRSLFKKK